MLSTLSNVSELLLAKGFEEMLRIFHNPITVHKQRVVQYTQLESTCLWYCDSTNWKSIREPCSIESTRIISPSVDSKIELIWTLKVVKNVVDSS